MVRQIKVPDIYLPPVLSAYNDAKGDTPMKQIELAADGCHRAHELLSNTLADFTDADMLVRPCPGANHTAWQLGHLISAETRLVDGAKPGAMPELPAGFMDKFKKETAGNDDPAFFPTKAQIFEQYAKTTAAAEAWIKSLSPADLELPAPEKFRQRIPTIGHLVALLPNHATMHVGQFQVIRRKLGKPILF
jgi:DinB superfamily